MKTIILIGTLLILAACSNSNTDNNKIGNISQPAGPHPGPQSHCPIQVSGSENNLDIAIAFFEWQKKDNPSEKEIIEAAQCLSEK